MKKMFLLFLYLSIICSTSFSQIFVKTGATGSNDGTSWTNAYTSFQSALDLASSGNQIWVAAGTYYPTTQIGGIGVRYATFQMKAGVAIYGGFAGTESSLSERNISANVTILSGDIGTIDVNTDNCYHVFYHPSGLGLASTAILDGFTIKGGNSNGSGIHLDGGGILNDASNNPTIKNCTISGNSAQYGGGICNVNSNAAIINCSFLGNTASSTGGGIANYTHSGPTITNCVFSSNSAQNGGGIYNYSECHATITNCTISNNSVTSTGGGMCDNAYYSSTVGYSYINNCIIWGNTATGFGNQIYWDSGTYLNYACISNGTNDMVKLSGNSHFSNLIYTDPQFVGSTVNQSHPYSIAGNSPCADAGNDSYITESYDIRGSSYSRKLNKTSGAAGTVDMGAYEYKVGNDPLPVELISFTGIATETKVTLNWKTASEVNNYGFNIETMVMGEDGASASISTSWIKLGFVQGHGNSNSPKEYSYVDENPPAGKLQYRLKQIDFDGRYEYSNSVEVFIAAPEQFKLSQNHPNPFNPTTKIRYDVPVSANIKLLVFDILGREVAELESGLKQAGSYELEFNANGLKSGVYFCRLTAGSVSITRKLILMK